MPKRLPRIAQFDGLRGMLSLWVVLAHCFCWAGFSQLGWGSLVDHCWKWFVIARPAVETFVILSGFAIAYFLDRDRLPWLGFVTQRFFRIFPVYLLCLLFAFVLIPLSARIVFTVDWQTTEYFQSLQQIALQDHQNQSLNLLSHLAGLHGAVPKTVKPECEYTILPPAWSISIEWQYYLLAPLLYPLMRRPISMAATFLGVLILQSLLGSHGNTAFVLTWLPLFFVGVGSFSIYKSLHQSEYQPGREAEWVVVGIVGVACFAEWHPFAICLWTLVFGGVFVRSEGFLGQFLHDLRLLFQGRMFQFLGKVSYSLYLIHWPMIVLILGLTTQMIPDLNRQTALLILLFLGFPMILASSWIVHVFVECPGMEIGKQLQKKPERYSLGSQKGNEDSRGATEYLGTPRTAGL